MSPSYYYFTAIGVVFKLRTLTKAGFEEFKGKFPEWELHTNFDTKEVFYYYKPSKEVIWSDRLSGYLREEKDFIEVGDENDDSLFIGVRVEGYEGKTEKFPGLNELLPYAHQWGRIYSGSIF